VEKIACIKRCIRLFPSNSGVGSWGHGLAQFVGFRVTEGVAVYLACSTRAFEHRPLETALTSIRDLLFAKVELVIGNQGAHITFDELERDPQRVVNILRASSLTFASFRVNAATDHPNLANHLRLACRLARVLAVPVLSLPAAEIGSDFNLEIKRLTTLTRIAEAEGVILTVPTDSTMVTADPLGARELCKRVSGLGLTYDPTHYLMNPHVEQTHEYLYPFVHHIRLRDSKPNRYQVRIGQGEFEYSRMITLLEREGYSRVLCVDMVREFEDPTIVVESEIRKLKYLLESMI
jgi:sugar phosphate isomerase/epimerase